MPRRPRLVIGNKNYSSWSLRAWLLLKHLRVDFEEVNIALYQGDFRQQLLRYSDAGKVPVYIEDGLTVWDSLAICEYFAETYPELWPKERAVRARARSVSAEMYSGLLHLRNELPMNCRARNRRVELSAGAVEDIARVDKIWSDCRRQHGGDGPWLFEDFGIADIMFAPVASRFLTYDIGLSGVATEHRDQILSSPLMRQWYREAERETEVIEHAETGV